MGYDIPYVFMRQTTRGRKISLITALVDQLPTTVTDVIVWPVTLCGAFPIPALQFGMFFVVALLAHDVHHAFVFGDFVVDPKIAVFAVVVHIECS
jgi:hypothetical protein